MRTQTFHLELITPCFCGGAEPDKQAEIRAPSIRGQLRWWFRTLGGFKSLQEKMSVRDQEAMIFGSAAGDQGCGGHLLVRVIPGRIVSGVKDGQELGHKLFSTSAYLTFPVQSREKNGQKTNYAGRGVLLSCSFALVVQWRGELSLWPDVESLVSVFGNLGALGFRERRAMGALAFTGSSGDVPSLSAALETFSGSRHLSIRQLEATGDKDAISNLGSWLRQWRAHGRTQDHAANRGDTSKPPFNAGFRFAKRDHDIGYGVAEARTKSAFRPALGLPIIQRTQTQPNCWDWEWDEEKRKSKGRFASPVLLRPHRDAEGQWHALVIFVDAHKWPNDPATGQPKQVFLNGRPRAVSLDLYEAMKSDPRLRPFP